MFSLSLLNVIYHAVKFISCTAPVGIFYYVRALYSVLSSMQNILIFPFVQTVQYDHKKFTITINHLKCILYI